jgi:sugar lactone lactonase YvrE
VALVAALAASWLVAAPVAGAQDRPRWDTRVLAKVPTPGYPALAYVHPNGRIYVGTFTNPRGDNQRSRVFEYTTRGVLVRSWTVPGQDLSAEHGVQVATSDRRGRLVLLDRSPSRALLLNRLTGTFRQYATFADLAPCPPAGAGQNCSPTEQDLKPVPNYGAWGSDGSLYVTDFQQGVIWRVPRGGGEAQIWLADGRLDGGPFGTTGIALAADRRTLVVAQGSSGGLPIGPINPTTGKLYLVEIRPDGSPGELRQLWESGPADLPDGFAIARSGNLYVPLAGDANQIAVVAPDGRELERFPRDEGSGENGSPAPFDTPSSARFSGTHLIVPNQSFATGDRERQTLLDVEVDEPGLRELIPGLDRKAPSLRRVRVIRRRGRGRPVLRIRFRLSEAALVTFRLERLRRGRFSNERTFSRRRRGGARRLNVSRPLAPGRYRVVFFARDGTGNLSRRVTRRFRVPR